MSYYFDTFIELKNTRYFDNSNTQVIIYKNSKDSSYKLQVFTLKDSVYADLYDYKQSLLIKYSVDETFKNSRDLNKLKNIRIYKNVTYHKEKKQKELFEDFEFERDTIKNQTLVHITKYKNSKRKKIVYENYYDFTNNKNIVYSNENSLKNHLLEKYNLLDIKNQNLETNIIVIDGKKHSETKFLKVNKIDYTYTFTINKVLPRYSFGKMWLN
ncbi:MAG: hypothetical protein V4548_03765 [Bacteroidota bacterium]